MQFGGRSAEEVPNAEQMIIYTLFKIDQEQ